MDILSKYSTMKSCYAIFILSKICLTNPFASLIRLSISLRVNSYSPPSFLRPFLCAITWRMRKCLFISPFVSHIDIPNSFVYVVFILDILLYDSFKTLSKTFCSLLPISLSSHMRSKAYSFCLLSLSLHLANINY